MLCFLCLNYCHLHQIGCLICCKYLFWKWHSLRPLHIFPHIFGLYKIDVHQKVLIISIYFQIIHVQLDIYHLTKIIVFVYCFSFYNLWNSIHYIVMYLNLGLYQNGSKAFLLSVCSLESSRKRKMRHIMSLPEI